MIPAFDTLPAPSWPPPVVERSNQWNQETRYDTQLSLFPVIPVIYATNGTVLTLALEFASELPLELKAWKAFDRGSSAGFDLIHFVTTPDHNWSGVRLVTKLRQISGLTWKQAADLVGVKPRTLHNWAAGQAIAEKNLRKLGEILALLRYIDKGYAEANRDLILNDSIDGRTLFALMEMGEFDRVKAHVGRGIGRPKTKAPLPKTTQEKWGTINFGTDLSAAEDITEEIVPVRPTGKRHAKARRKS